MRLRKRIVPTIAATIVLVAVGTMPAEAYNKGTVSGDLSQGCSVVWEAAAVLDADLKNDDPKYPNLMTDGDGKPLDYTNGGYIKEVRPELGAKGMLEINHFYTGLEKHTPLTTAKSMQHWRIPIATNLPMNNAAITVRLPAELQDVVFDPASTNSAMQSWGGTYAKYTWAERPGATAVKNADGTWTVNLGNLSAKTGTVIQFNGRLPVGTDTRDQFVASATVRASYPQGIGSCAVTDVPPLPSRPSVGACQVNIAGRAVWGLHSDDINERQKYAGTESGEANVDGWLDRNGQRMIRVYGATKIDVKNATFTMKAAQGATIPSGAQYTIITPGGGELQQNGFTARVSGASPVKVSADGKTATFTIASLPAKSSFSFDAVAEVDNSMKPIVFDLMLSGTQTKCDTPSPTTIPSKTATKKPTKMPATGVDALPITACVLVAIGISWAGRRL